MNRMLNPWILVGIGVLMGIVLVGIDFYRLYNHQFDVAKIGVVKPKKIAQSPQAKLVLDPIAQDHDAVQKADQISSTKADQVSSTKADQVSSTKADAYSLLKREGDTPETPPSVRIFNAYNTRTFWRREPLVNVTEDFTFVIECDVGKDLKNNQKFRPLIQWEAHPQGQKVSSNVPLRKGIIWGDGQKKVQVIKLPPQAWRVESNQVAIKLKMEMVAADGPSLSDKATNATINIRSLAQYEGKEHLLLTFGEDMPKATTGGWLSHWGKVSAQQSKMNIYLSSGVLLKAFYERLGESHDFVIKSLNTPPPESASILLGQGSVQVALLKGSLSSAEQKRLETMTGDHFKK